MSENKKISAVGTAFPATDTEINRKTSISYFDGKIKYILQKITEGRT